MVLPKQTRSHHDCSLQGRQVEAVFEPHDEATPPYTLVQWRLAGGA